MKSCWETNTKPPQVRNILVKKTSETYRKHHYCNLYKRKERHLVCNHTGMEPDLQRQIQSLQSILINEEIQDKEIASVSYKYFYCKDT